MSQELENLVSKLETKNLEAQNLTKSLKEIREREIKKFLREFFSLGLSIRVVGPR